MGGCAGPSRPVAAISDAPGPAPTTQPLSPNATLTFVQVAAQTLPATQPATRPSTQPALAAVELYARARGALQERQAYTAVDLLEKAVKLDPDSPELRFALGRAYLLRGGSPDRAVEELRRATELNPQSLDAWLELARVHLRFDPPRALQPLIAATRTGDYVDSDAEAAVVDFHLARILQQGGYDQAAVDVYERLLRRLARRSLSIRGNPDVAALAANPEPVQIELGKLYERLGQPDRALAIFERVALSVPDAFDPQARVVRSLLAAGRNAQAARRAGELVRTFSASPASVELLLEVHRRLGDESRALDELQKLHRADPTNQRLLMGLADALVRLGRAPDAQSLLTDAVKRAPDDVRILRRLLKLQIDSGDAAAAAQTLLEASTRNPVTAATDLWPLWRPMLDDWRAGALRPTDLPRMEVPAPQDPARQYWRARLAMESNREVLADLVLKQATSDPATLSAFPSLLSLRLAQVWQSRRYDAAEKLREADAIMQAARACDDPALVARFEAIDAFYRASSPDDLPAFERAEQAAANQLPPDVLLLYAESLRRANQTQRFEQVMWKLLSDYPRTEEAYVRLFEHYLREKSAGQALKVLNTWSAADPDSVLGRLFYAQVMSEARQPVLAEGIINDLLRDHADDREVLTTYLRLSAQGDRLQQAIDRLEEIRRRDPANGAVVQVLFAVYTERGDTAAINRLLEATSDAAAGRANLLYYIAQMYHAIGQAGAATRLLERALEVDPAHIPASNDLAYFWSESGEHLARGEELARRAVAAEPQNAAYLDTLGWVLYKQGRFDEARRFLEQAVSIWPPPDPVLLDHLGDAAHRAGDPAAAVANWQKAANLLRAGTPGVQPDRPEHEELRIKLQSKLRQHLNGEPVEVAPAAGDATGTD